MKAIQHTGTMGSIRAKVDRSVSYTITSPELSANEKVTIMDLQDQVLEVTLRPFDNPEAKIVEVKGEIQTKSQSQRLKAVIAVIWKFAKERNRTDKTIDKFYFDYMEKLIEKGKEQIEELE